MAPPSNRALALAIGLPIGLTLLLLVVLDYLWERETKPKPPNAPPSSDTVEPPSTSSTKDDDVTLRSKSSSERQPLIAGPVLPPAPDPPRSATPPFPRDYASRLRSA